MINLLSGTRILEETTSKYNGKVTVVRDFTWGTYIKVNGLTQSGGILANIWKSTLRQISNDKFPISNVLILGLGGGSVAKIVHKNYPKTKITGVDIDKKMVGLGKKYLGLSKIDINIQITDAYTFVNSKSQKPNSNYDLILIDLYCGDKFPEKFEDEEFMIGVKNVLNKNGLAIFNRLYGSDNRSSAMEMGRALEKIFKKVDYVYPMANVMFVCYN